MEQNPRILDLRQQLNRITLRKERCEKARLENEKNRKEDEDGFGPHSLLFNLQPSSSTPTSKIIEKNVWNNPEREKNVLQDINRQPIDCVNKIVDRLPNVLSFEDKPMKEFEYSCQNDILKTFNTHSRSDLSLQLKSHVHSRNLETNLSPNENSLSKTNEENSLDDSLGILTPDQMDDICYLDNTFSPTVEGLPIFDNAETKLSPENGDTPSTEKTESNSAASTIENAVPGKEEDFMFPPVSHVDDPQPPDSKNISLEKEKSDLVKDDLLPHLLEEEFMPSIHSSILEPDSSIGETTVNLDLPLDCKHETRLVVHRIEQTPSPEDLPLDSSDMNGEISTYSQFSASTLHDTNSFSEAKNDYQKSMETSKVSNSFITSITSITSLDGYQGDGEMSRPVSRGGDHSIGHREDVIEMAWQNVPVNRRADPMTDSDFFTESDADGLDEHMQRGDRRAQVIDGALYGGKSGNGNLPLIVNRNEDSCMESSGVYTDFENHRSSPVFLNVIDDMSPEGSTPSTRSECSQKHSNGKLEGYYDPLDDIMKEEVSGSPCLIDELETPKNTSKRNSLNSVKDEGRINEKNKEEKKIFTLKKYKMPRRDMPSKLKTMLTNRKTDNDASVQSSPKIVKKTERRENLAKKNTDFKNDYKVKSYKDIKSKVDTSLSLQRSQTSCSVTRKSLNNNIKPKSRHVRRLEMGSATGSGKSSLHSSQSDISAASSPLGKLPTPRFLSHRNGKKRESAPTPPTPAKQPPTPQPPPTALPKKNGVVQKLSASPVGNRARAPVPPASPRKPAARRNPPQRPATLPTLPTTNHKEPARVTTAVAAVGPRSKRAQTPQSARPSPAPLAAPLVASLPAPLPPLAPAPRDCSADLAHASKGFEALGVLVQYLVFRLDALNGGTWKLEAERWRGVAASERAGAARADRDRQQRAQKDLDTIAECLSKISELEMEVSSKEEENARLQATHLEEVTSLANDIKDLKDTIECLKREVAESRARLHAHSEIERTLRAQLEAVRAEQSRDTSAEVSCDLSYDKSYNKSYNTCDAACDPVCCETEECELRLKADEELSTDANELAAEVRSLRAVVELKQAELGALRGARSELCTERERRSAAERAARAARHAAEELRERAAQRLREADALREDNRRLREAAARDRDHATRLAALNEELRYKLRTKSQVVSLLAGSGYLERAGMGAGAGRVRTESGESARWSPPPESPPSPGSPQPSSPAVKAVVEKHDSVSWVLEIEETPEEVASRLTRKSSFRNGVSSTGVKRRGGGSPGNSSPAPASPAPNASKLFRPGELDFPPQPPPLKESAGEAIYIYDDRQY